MSERQFFLVYNLCLEKVCDGRKLIKSLKPLLISLYFTAKRGNMCKDLLKHANINRTAYMAFASCSKSVDVCFRWVLVFPRCAVCHDSAHNFYWWNICARLVESLHFGGLRFHLCFFADDSDSCKQSVMSDGDLNQKPLHQKTSCHWFLAQFLCNLTSNYLKHFSLFPFLKNGASVNSRWVDWSLCIVCDI